MSKILVTGSAGFIGFHLIQKLLDRGDEIVGIDNLNGYYDPESKSSDITNAQAPYKIYNIENINPSPYAVLLQPSRLHAGKKLKKTCFQCKSVMFRLPMLMWMN